MRAQRRSLRRPCRRRDLQGVLRAGAGVADAAAPGGCAVRARGLVPAAHGGLDPPEAGGPAPRRARRPGLRRGLLQLGRHEAAAGDVRADAPGREREPRRALPCAGTKDTSE